MIKHWDKPISAFVYVHNDALASGESLMGTNIVDVIHKTLKCRSKINLERRGSVYKIEVTICKINPGE